MVVWNMELTQNVVQKVLCFLASCQDGMNWFLLEDSRLEDSRVVIFRFPLEFHFNIDRI